ncbi:MAG: hypothetical protein KatS3mg024_0804 [Armatimonadota bacterium]|nr:MAG: hypothetical protein KatS3mg024_0804 [Armatimonadota bacterium]
MDTANRSEGPNVVALAAGVISAIVVAGLIGRLLYERTRPLEGERDIREIIRECQATIAQMDRALGKPSAAAES